MKILERMLSISINEIKQISTCIYSGVRRFQDTIHVYTEKIK